MQIETLILRNLMLNEDYTRTVIPHLKLIYFEEPYRAVFSEIVDFVNKYNKLPKIFKSRYPTYSRDKN